MEHDVFKAIADPTRREIMAILLAEQPLNINDIAGRFRMSRPAVSKHIKILSDSGLVLIWQEGRERYCALEIRSLQSVSEWLRPYEAFWNKNLERLGDFLAKND